MMTNHNFNNQMMPTKTQNECQNSEVTHTKTSKLLTLIMAPDEMRKSVARSFTFLIRAATSD